MKFLKNKPFDKIHIGDTACLSRVLTKKDILLFSIVSGDLNPAHVDIEYAKKDLFHKIVGHGMWTAALISRVLGEKLPGPGTIYLSQSLKFHHPVFIGDKITVKLTVVKKYQKKSIVVFDCICTNQSRKSIVTGIAKVLAPTEMIKRKKVRLPRIILRE